MFIKSLIGTAAYVTNTIHNTYTSFLRFLAFKFT